jgi:uncharacterized protein (DUF302 family)
VEASSYGFGRRLDLPFAAAVEKVKVALKAQGFGVLTEIDIQRALREKLGVEFRDYAILGACNPPLAHKALSTDLEVGLLLPCNVVVYAEDGGSVVRVMDPEAALTSVGGESLRLIAVEAKRRLSAMVASLAD